MGYVTVALFVSRSHVAFDACLWSWVTTSFTPGEYLY